MIVHLVALRVLLAVVGPALLVPRCQISARDDKIGLLPLQDVKHAWEQGFVVLKITVDDRDVARRAR